MSIQTTIYTSTLLSVKYINVDTGEKNVPIPLPEGTQKTQLIDTPEDLENIIKNLSQHQSLGYGVFPRSRSKIVTDKYLSEYDAKNGRCYSRTQKYVSWPNGGGVLFLDFDGKFNASDVPHLREVLKNAIPSTYDAPQLWTHSNSGCVLINGVQQKGGLHCYILVDTASDIERIGEILYSKLWLSGYGYHTPNKPQKAALERNLIDGAVWQPERLDFAGLPIVEGVGTGVIQSSVIARFNNDNTYLNCKKIPNITAEEKEAVDELVNISLKKCQETIGKIFDKRIREATTEKEKHQLISEKYTSTTNILTREHPIYLKDGVITVGDIIDNREKYHNTLCDDPRDGDYGKYKAKIFTNRTDIKINSMAHGGMRFTVVDKNIKNIDKKELTTNVSDYDIIKNVKLSRKNEKDGGIKAKTYDESFKFCEQKLNVSLERIQQTWTDFIMKNALPFHQSLEAEKEFDLFSEAVSEVDTHSIFLQAPLGSGKTSKFAQPIIEKAIDDNRAVITTTTLCALTSQMSQKFQTNHYRDEKSNILDGKTMTITIDALVEAKANPTEGNAPFLTFWNTVVCKKHNNSLFLIDEAASVISKMLSSGVPYEKKIAFIELLIEAVDSDVQLIFMDGDVTPQLKLLLTHFDIPVWKVNEQEYKQPKVNFYVENKNQELVIELFEKYSKNNEKIVIATDGKKTAEKLESTIKKEFPNNNNIMINAVSKLLSKQKEFLDNPNNEIKEYESVIYSPVLSAGFSVTSTEARVITYITNGVLLSAGNWQSSRRFRWVKDNEIDYVVSHEGAMGRGGYIGNIDKFLDTVKKEANLLGDKFDLVSKMEALELWSKRMYQHSPIDMNIGHLLNCGIEVDFIGNPTARDGDYDKLSVRDKTIENIIKVDEENILDSIEELKMGAKTLIDFEREANTVRQKMEYEHLKIRYPLGLMKEEMTPELIQEVMSKNVLTVVKNRYDLEHHTTEKVSESKSFADRDFIFAKTQILRGILNTLKDDYTVDKGRKYLKTLKKEVKIMYKMSSVPDITDSPEKISSYYRNTLNQYGYKLVKTKYSGKTGTNYKIETNPLYDRYYEGFIRIKNDEKKLIPLVNIPAKNEIVIEQEEAPKESKIRFAANKKLGGMKNKGKMKITGNA